LADRNEDAKTVPGLRKPSGDAAPTPSGAPDWEESVRVDLGDVGSAIEAPELATRPSVTIAAAPLARALPRDPEPVTRAETTGARAPSLPRWAIVYLVVCAALSVLGLAAEWFGLGARLGTL
jgi:hypothetical protein